ncbi:MAG TPA: NADH-quinone oxidoreductase subunit NuoK [Coriobacteriia bacterium]|nr:NADH-quinone oxidoreductase subunit NuoK [Coriobacteriia bacterium]
MTMGLSVYLLIAAALFSLGVYGAVSKRGAVQVLMSLEMMSVAVNLNLIAFSRYITPEKMTGQFFTAFQMVVSAAEIGLGLALVVAIVRAARTAEVDRLSELKG